MADLMTMYQSLQTGLAAHRSREGERSPVEIDAEGTTTPVALLNGFLGAGKSTLLAAALLNPPNNMAIRAVVNDLGAMPIDPSLIFDHTELEFELSNGCGCCAGTDELAATLDRVGASDPDLVLLESSGVTDPFAVAQLVEGSPNLRLDRIVTVVDAVGIDGQLADYQLGPIVRRHLEAAHTVVVTRSEELDGASLDGVTQRLELLVPGRPVVRSTLTAPAVHVLWPGSIRGAALPEVSDVPAHDLITLTIDQTVPLSIAAVNEALSAVGPAIVRCKGRLRTLDGQVMIQGTSSGWEVREASSSDTPVITIVGTEACDVASLAISLGCP
ncbi:MAG: G3E family GTPase [Acidimicrobiales bacterium]|jgi:G3E family GTPase